MQKCHYNRSLVSAIHSFPPRIRVKDRMPRDETIQRANDWSPNRHQGDNHIHKRNIPSHGQTAFAPSPSAHQQSDSAVDLQPYFTMPAQGGTSMRHPEPPEAPPRRRVSADQIYAAHREARLEARQALKEEAHTEGLLKSRKAVLPSEIRRRERSVDDPNRLRHEDLDCQSFSPEQQRRNRQEDWDREYPRERGRERTVQRIRERQRDIPRKHQSLEPQDLQNEFPAQRCNDVAIEYSSREKDDQRTYVHFEQSLDALRSPEHDLQGQEPSFQENKCRQEPQLHDDLDTLKQQQQQFDPPVQQNFDSAVYLQRGGPSLPQAKHRGSESTGVPKSKIRTRSMSDIGISQHSAMYRMERVGGGRESARGGHPAPSVNGEHSLGGALDTRVSVAQLRHSYLENANRKPEV